MNSKVYPTYKTKYRVANWASYDRALVGRGDVTLWVSPEAIATWEPLSVGTRGGQQKYSDVAIETALTLRLLFHLPLRQAEGFLQSLFGMMVTKCISAVAALGVPDALGGGPLYYTELAEVVGADQRA